MKINYLTHEGAYVKLSPPRDVPDIKCLRCGGVHGHVFHEKQDLYSWFCLNPECLEIDKNISKSIARDNFMKKKLQEI